jgi:hypothetical protein
MSCRVGLIDKVGADESGTPRKKNFHKRDTVLDVSEVVEWRFEIGEFRVSQVTVRDHWSLIICRPIETEAVPEDASICRGRVDRIGFVNKAGVFLKGQETVCEPNRNVDNVTVCCREQKRGSFTKG